MDPILPAPAPGRRVEVARGCVNRLPLIDALAEGIAYSPPVEPVKSEVGHKSATWLRQLAGIEFVAKRRRPPGRVSLPGLGSPASSVTASFPGRNRIAGDERAAPASGRRIR